MKVYAGSGVSGSPVATLSASVGAGGAWSVTPSSALTPDGIYTARAQQSDAAGNTGFSSPSTFTIDTQTVTDEPGSTSGVTQTVSVTSVTTPVQPVSLVQPVSPVVPPLIARLRVPRQRLMPVLAHGFKLLVGSSVPADANLRVSIDGGAARRLRLTASSQPVVIERLTTPLAGPRMLRRVVRIKHRFAVRLRLAARVPLTLRLVVADHLGRVTSLTAHIVLRR